MAERMLKFVGTPQAMPDKRPAAERRHDFQEIYTAYARERAVEQAARCSQCGVPFCQIHCPLNNNIPDWLRWVQDTGLPRLHVRLPAGVRLDPAGLRKDCREIYPTREILQLAFQKRVPITFGSDAHAPGEVGMNFTEAVQLARGVGYTECCRFAQRKRTVTGF